MIEAGRRLTSLDFVAFVLLFRDLMRRAVAPWSIAIQSASLETWALQKKQVEHRTVTRQVSSLLRWMKEFFRVCVLLRQHVSLQDVGALIQACFFASPRVIFLSAASDPHAGCAWGKLLPAFTLALKDFLHGITPTFRKVELFSPVPPALSSQMCLGPHCQCSFLSSRTQSRNPQAARIKVQHKHVRVPAWVANSVPGAVTAGTEGEPAPLRFHYRDHSTPSPAGVNMANKFRPTLRDHVSRCQRPHGLPQALGCMSNLRRCS